MIELIFLDFLKILFYDFYYKMFFNLCINIKIEGNIMYVYVNKCM